MKEGIFTNPEVGDRFIFTVKGNDRPYKLKAFTGDSVEFFIPMYGNQQLAGKQIRKQG